MKLKLTSSRWFQLVFLSWIIAAQLWYYLQFKSEFRAALAPILHKLWH